MTLSCATLGMMVTLFRTTQGTVTLSHGALGHGDTDPCHHGDMSFSGCSCEPSRAVAAGWDVKPVCVTSGPSGTHPAPFCALRRRQA